jgi:hypothetical protein
MAVVLCCTDTKKVVRIFENLKQMLLVFFFESSSTECCTGLVQLEFSAPNSAADLFPPKSVPLETMEILNPTSLIVWLRVFLSLHFGFYAYDVDKIFFHHHQPGVPKVPALPTFQSDDMMSAMWG